MVLNCGSMIWPEILNIADEINCSTVENTLSREDNEANVVGMFLPFRSPDENKETFKEISKANFEYDCLFDDTDHLINGPGLLDDPKQLCSEQSNKIAAKYEEIDEHIKEFIGLKVQSRRQDTVLGRSI